MRCNKCHRPMAGTSAYDGACECGGLIEASPEDAFRELCKAHDLTFTYSDDGAVYDRGRKQLLAIKEAAKELPPGMAVEIWNQVVREKILPGYEKQYQWEGA